MAVLLYTMGLSISAIARLFKISTPAALRWIRNFAERHYENRSLARQSSSSWMKCGALSPFKKTDFGSGRLIVAMPVGSLIGDAGGVIKDSLHD
jgi:hypothetical protein